MELVSNAVLVQGVTLQDLERMVKRVVSQQLEEYKKRLPPPQKAVVTKKSPTYIKKKDVAKMLGVSLTTIDEWVRAGILRPCKISSRVYFTDHEIDRAMGNTAPY